METDINAVDFIAKIFAARNEDEVVAVSQPMRHVDQDSPPWWTVPADNNSFLRHVDDPAEWYFCVATVDGEATPSGKGIKRGRKNIRRIYALVLDDVGSKASRPPVQPCWIMETSEGNYQWGYIIEPTDDIEFFEACVAWCAEQGWTDAGAGGGYRVMRVPGSVNTKPGRARWQSRLTHFDPCPGPLSGLMKELGCQVDALELKSAMRQKRASSFASSLTTKDGIDDVVGWLSDQGRIISTDTPEWIGVRCPNAAEHSDGSETAYYSPLGQGDGKFIQYRNFKCHHAHCADLDTAAFLKWVADHGGPKVNNYDPMPWLLDRYAIVTRDKLFIDTVICPYGAYDFDREAMWFRHPGKIALSNGDRVKIADALVNDDRTLRVDRMSYHPGQPLIFEQEGQPCLNLYKEPFHPETTRYPELFLDHVTFLLPDPAERDCFLNWLAYKIQHPDRRSYAIVMVASGDFGVGRSSLGAFLKRIFGDGQVRNASLGQLIGRGKGGTQTFNDWMSRCQMVVVEEAKEIQDDAKAIHTGYEEFKTLVDNQPTVQRINPKFGRTYMERVFFNVLIFSNHVDAIVMPEGDRRIAVFRNPDKRQDKAYYDRLADGLNDAEAAAAYWWLRRRDLTGYDPVYPPVTDSKQAMITETRGPVEKIFDWLVENYKEDTLTRSQLESACVSACIDLGLDHRMSSAYRGHLWRQMGSLRPGDKNGLRATVDNKQQEIRAIRHKDKYFSG